MANKPTDDEFEREVKELEEMDQHKQAEKVPSESEERFRNFLDNLGDSAYETDSSGNVTYANKASEILTGMPLKDIIGKPFLPLFPKESQETAIDVYQRTLNGENPEFELTFVNGRVGFFKNEPLKDKNGKIIGVFGIVRDITDRKRVEEALRANEEKYRTLIGNILGMVYRANPDWTTEIISNSETICGYTSNEFNSQKINWLDLIHPDDKSRVFNESSKLKEKPSEMIQEYRIIAKDGNIHWVRDSKKSYCIEGVFHGIDGVVTDISEQKQAEMAIEKFFEQPMNLHIIAGFDGSIHRVNKGWETFLGYSKNELDGTFFYDLVHPDDLASTAEEMKKLGKGETTFYFENRYRHKDGNYRLLAWSAIASLKDQLVYAVASDITDRKQAEEQIKISLKEKEILLQEIHHRVKNNMQVISSLLRLQAASVEDERVSDALMECQGRVQAMAFVHETLYGSDTLAVIDLKAYIFKVASQIFQTYQTSMDRVKLEIDAEDIKLGIEQAMPLGLIVTELTTNSLKYAFPENRSGEIVIRMRAVEQDSLEFVFSDNGIGMPEDLDWQNADSLGIQLVMILAEDQLDGTVNLNRRKGMHFTVRFRPKKYR